MRNRAIGAVCLAASVIGLPRASAAPEPFRIDVKAIRLEIGDRIVPSVVEPLAEGEVVVGDLILAVDRNRLAARERGSGKQRWVSLLPAGRRIEVRGTGPATLLATFGSVRGTESGGESLVPDEPGPLRRLSLVDGSWLPPWPTGPGETVRVLTDAQGAVVLSTSARTWTTTAFDWGGDRPRWSHRFDVSSATPTAARRSDGSLLLQGAGDDVLLCDWTRSTLVALDRATGELEWRVDRIWEFDRRFVQLQNAEWDVRRPSAAVARADLAKRSRVVDGPYVVPHEEDYRVFVAVDRDRVEGTVEPVPESRTYEVSAWGGVTSVTPLPRSADRGSAATSLGVLWGLEDGLLLQTPSHQEPGGFRGLGATDLQGWVTWSRRLPPEVPEDPWLRTHAHHAPLAVLGETAFVAAGPACVREKADAAFRIPLRRIDVSTGTESAPALTLVVPFVGALPSLEGTSHSKGSRAGKEQIETYGNFGVALAALAIRDERLVVTLATSERRIAVEFPVDALK